MTDQGPRTARLIPPGVTGRELTGTIKPKGHRVRVGQHYESRPSTAGASGHVRKGGLRVCVAEVRGRMVILRRCDTGMTICIRVHILRLGWTRK